MEKPYIVYMCIVEIHEMKQGENQSKGRPTISDKTCCEKLQKYLFFGLTLTKMLAVELKDRFPPPPLYGLYSRHL